MGHNGCVVLVPVHGAIHPQTEVGLWELARRGYAVRYLRDASDIVLARSQMATDALRDGFDETLWVDADVVFSPEDADRLRAHDLPLVAGLYVRKGRPEFAAKFLQDTVTFGEGGGLVEMVYVGMGFTLVRRAAYNAVTSAWMLPECGGGYDGKTVVPYFLPMLVSVSDPARLAVEYLSEDYSFCHRARAAGVTVLADTTIKLGHAGGYAYTWDDLVPRQRYGALRVGVADPTDHGVNGASLPGLAAADPPHTPTSMYEVPG